MKVKFPYTEIFSHEERMAFGDGTNPATGNDLRELFIPMFRRLVAETRDEELKAYYQTKAAEYQKKAEA